MQSDTLHEARRQLEICNACRYCEGYCSVFPQLHSQRALADGDISHIANLCHNCRGCYYACQYTAPHEFNLNIPGTLEEIRRQSWEDYAWPQPFARAFHRSGVAISVFFILAFAVVFGMMQFLGQAEGSGFYAVLSHTAMVAIFLPAFLFPLVSLAISVRRFWVDIKGGSFRLTNILNAARSAGSMKDLSGGHGEGCNFEDEDRFTHARRYAHQLLMYGFGFCFLSTASGTVLHYGFDWPAPYGFWSPPKLLGVPGGIMMVVGSIWMLVLKLRSDRSLGDAKVWGGDMAFILLLCAVAISGLALYGLGSTPAMPILLALHLGAVLTLFLMTPFSKMAHGFYRLAAMAKA